MPKKANDQETAYKLLNVGTKFNIPGPFFSFEEMKNGNVNRSYKVNYICDDGTGMAKIRSYIMQRINMVAFNKPIELMENIDKVTSFIQENFPEATCLDFHHTDDGNNYYLEDDSFWRVYTYIPSVTFNSGGNLVVVRNTGRAFGNFQVMLNDFDASKLHFTIPDFHNTRKRFANLRKSAEENKADRLSKVQAELDWLFSVEDEACCLTDLYNEGKLPLRVTHNDTKINNVLFNEETFDPVAVIDLDTVMPGLVGHDFGDAIRFAANFVEEDCPDTSKAGLDLNTFWAFAEGFLSQTATTLTDMEVDTLAASCFAITVELATRFLADYLDGDIYFKVKNQNHNLVRTQTQIALAKDMHSKLDAMNAICRNCCEKYRKNH